MWDADTDTEHHHESGIGCWPAAACMGAGTFDFDIGIIQFFCTQEQHDTAASMDAPRLAGTWNQRNISVNSELLALKIQTVIITQVAAGEPISKIR